MTIMDTLANSTSAALTSDIPLTPREALSGMFGSISIACWIVFLFPQVIENYRNQSAEALSLLFIVVWFAGDLTNFFGGLWAGLIPTAIAQAAWFIVMDTVLVSQSLYYSIRNRRREGKTWLQAARASMTGTTDAEAAEAVAKIRRQQLERAEQRQRQEEEDDEEQPLLKRTVSGSAHRGANHTSTTTTTTTTSEMTPAQRRTSLNQEMARRRRSSGLSTTKPFEANPTTTTTTSKSGLRYVLQNILGLLGAYLLGAVAWFLAYKLGYWHPIPLHQGPPAPIAGGAQVLGYASSILYLGARIPQIVKNYREKSCEGLSLLFFMLSMSGNITYGMGILFHSTERRYVITNLSWLIGSMGTIVQDLTIFAQFRIYGTNIDETAIE